MPEGDKHYLAKTRARSILSQYLGCEYTSIEEPKQGKSFDAEKNWSLDAYGEIKIRIAIEIDGKKGHGTKITNAKDKLRDDDNLKRNDVYTVRFKTADLIGNKSLSVAEIISEIQYSLSEQGLPLLYTWLKYTKKIIPEQNHHRSLA